MIRGGLAAPSPSPWGSRGGRRDGGMAAGRRMVVGENGLAGPSGALAGADADWRGVDGDWYGTWGGGSARGRPTLSGDPR